MHPSTSRQYEKSYLGWLSFCTDNGLNPTPADVSSVMACLALTASETESISAVEKLQSAIAFEHRRQCMPSPTSHESLSLLMRGIRRCLQVGHKPKRPLTHDLLRCMIDHLHLPDHGQDGLRAPLVLWHTVWRANMEFYTLGHFDDIVRLRVASVLICHQPRPHLKIHFSGDKNDIFSEGSERVVCAHSPTDRYCPVHLTELYLRRLGLTYSGYLVPRTKQSFGSLVAGPDRPLSYTMALEDLCDLLDSLGQNASEYGWRALWKKRWCNSCCLGWTFN